MALYRFAMKARAVKAGSKDAGKAVRYLMRMGEYAPQQRDVDYLTRQSPTTRDRTDLVHAETINLPSWAEGSPARFYTTAEDRERANGRYAVALEIALPRELEREQQLTLARDFVRAQLADKTALWVMHEPVASDGETQPHIHMLFSERTHDGIDREPDQFFKRWNREHPERGGAQKDPFFHERRAPERLRQSWADLANFSLERAGIEARIDPRSLHDRALSRDMAERETPEGRAHTQALAHEAWEWRKEQLGITDVHTLDKEEFLAMVHASTREGKPGRYQSTEQLRAQEQTLTAQVAALDQQAARLGAEAALIHLRAEQGQTLHPVAEERLTKLLEHGATLGLDRDLTHRWNQPLIGNKNSQIYHTPEHKNYGDVAPKNQVHFWTEQAAMDAGYRRAVNDHYGRGTGVAMTEEPWRADIHARHHNSNAASACAIDARLAAIRARQQEKVPASVADKLSTGMAALDVDDEAPRGGLKARLTDRARDGWSY